MGGMTNITRDENGSTVGQAVLVDDRERWVTHKGKKILVNDYSNLAGDDIATVCIELSKRIHARDAHDLLFLCDVTETYANKAALATFKEWSVKNKPFLKKSALLGVVGVTKFFLQIVEKVSGIGAKTFDDLDSALDWLVE